jgi:hypothetical protein
MKKLIYLSILIVVTLTQFDGLSQGVAINEDNSTPNASAILDVKSTTKGMLIPRMTTVQRNAIVSPVEGLIIYNTTTNETNQRQDGAWRALITSDYWYRGANTMWNIGDNIGINTAGPSERLDVSGNIRSNNSMIIDNASAILQLRSGAVNKGFVQLSGDNLRLGTNSGNATGNVVIRMNGNDRITINPAGDMNIEGKITNTDATGSAPLTPACYGKVGTTGNVISGTQNFTVTRLSEGFYKVFCAGITLNSIVVVTGSISYVSLGCISWAGNFELRAYDNFFEDFRDVTFSFIVYNP